MAEEKPRLARLTSILTTLQSKSLVTARALAEKHGVSIRTVYRDIRTLEKSGVPISTEEGKGYRLMEGYQLPPVMFTEEEANALITAQQIVANNIDQSLVKTYTDAIDKIKSVLHYSTKENADLLQERIQIRSYVEKKETHYLMQLQSAIVQEKVVRLNYCSLKKIVTERDVEPFALINTWDTWLLIAYCRLRADFRTFRMDGIKQLQLTLQTFPPHQMTLEEYFEERKKLWNCTPDIGLTSDDSTFDANTNQTIMNYHQLAPFKVIGLCVRTTNQNGKAAEDIGQLWETFVTKNIKEAIPNKLDDEILSIYTNYGGDHTDPYDTVLGCRVSSIENVPEGMIGIALPGGKYEKFVCKGDLMNGALYHSWMEIWNKDIDRAYTADFEVHGEKAMDKNNAEVEIFIALNE